MLKKLLITGGIGLAAYVVNYMRKEYDKNVSDYNNLLDRYNEMSDFVQKCDFYKYRDSSSNDVKSRYVNETQNMSDGSKQTITRDVATGFRLITTKRA